MAMKVFRCRICGETYLGEECPDKCPFCGVTMGFLVDGSAWTDENIDLELTEASKKNIEQAIEIEVSNTRFYLCAAANAKGDNELEGMFKRLSKVENEHASLLSKMLKNPVPEIIKTPEECSEAGLDNIEESSRRETRAIELYLKFQGEATENRVKAVFAALSAVERTHLQLDEKEKLRLES